MRRRQAGGQRQSGKGCADGEDRLDPFTHGQQRRCRIAEADGLSHELPRDALRVDDVGDSAAFDVESLALRRSRVMNAWRMEVTGFDPSILPILKALGCRTEIIAWKTRAFLPLGDRPALDRLLKRFPQAGETKRQAMANAA